MNRKQLSQRVRQAGGRIVYEDGQAIAYAGLTRQELREIGEECGQDWEIIETHTGPVLQVYYA